VVDKFSTTSPILAISDFVASIKESFNFGTCDFHLYIYIYVYVCAGITNSFSILVENFKQLAGNIAEEDDIYNRLYKIQFVEAARELSRLYK